MADKLTLAQWVRDHHQTLVFSYEDGMFSCNYSNKKARVAANNLADFDVIVAGAALHFHGRYLKSAVKTREDFLALSYFTLCGISDAMMISTIEGMVHAVSREGDYHGLLYTDTLGNFLAIE